MVCVVWFETVTECTTRHTTFHITIAASWCITIHYTIAACQLSPIAVQWPYGITLVSGKILRSHDDVDKLSQLEVSYGTSRNLGTWPLGNSVSPTMLSVSSSLSDNPSTTGGGSTTTSNSPTSVSLPKKSLKHFWSFLYRNDSHIPHSPQECGLWSRPNLNGSCSGIYPGSGSGSEQNVPVAPAPHSCQRRMAVAEQWLASVFI